MLKPHDDTPRKWAELATENSTAGQRVREREREVCDVCTSISTTRRDQSRLLPVSIYLGSLTTFRLSFFLLKQKSCCSDGGGDFINVNHSAGLSTTKCLHHLAVIYPKALMGKSLLKSPFGEKKKKKKNTKQIPSRRRGRLSLSLFISTASTRRREKTNQLGLVFLYIISQPFST